MSWRQAIGGFGCKLQLFKIELILVCDEVDPTANYTFYLNFIQNEQKKKKTRNANQHPGSVNNYVGGVLE